jgi:hypothetical protein
MQADVETPPRSDWPRRGSALTPKDRRLGQLLAKPCYGFPHTAPTSGCDGEPLAWPSMEDGRFREPVVHRL